MNRRGFLAGLLAAPVVLRFAGALSPKPIAAPVVEQLEPILVSANSYDLFKVGDLITVSGGIYREEVLKITAVHLGSTPEHTRLTVERGNSNS